MSSRSYWRGFTVGALAGAGVATTAVLATNLWGRAGRSRILRLEKSIQIGRPVEEVFQAWYKLERLPAMTRRIFEIRTSGNRSHWQVKLNGRELEWDAVIEQLVPNQAIGWKSVTGPKHSGRISFAPMGKDTLVHVSMNYAPPSRLLRPLMAPMTGNLEGYIEAVLRDVKEALESGGEKHGYGSPQGVTGGITAEPARATGTFGAMPEHPAQTSEPQNPRFGGTANPVEFTAPPEAKR